MQDVANSLELAEPIELLVEIGQALMRQSAIEARLQFCLDRTLAVGLYDLGLIAILESDRATPNLIAHRGFRVPGKTPASSELPPPVAEFPAAPTPRYRTLASHRPR